MCKNPTTNKQGDRMILMINNYCDYNGTRSQYIISQTQQLQPMPDDQQLETTVKPDNSQEVQQKNDELQHSEATQIHNPQFYEEEEEEEQQNYKFQEVQPIKNQKEILMEQNIKLKTQIYELALQLDEILLRDKMKRKKYGGSNDDEDEAVKAKKLELKKQQLQIMATKNRIFQLKRQVDLVHNSQVVQEKEDRLKQLSLRVRELADEKEGLIKVRKGQAKAIKTLHNDDDYNQRIEKTRHEIAKVKEHTKKLKYEAIEAKRQEIKCHEVYVLKKQRVRELDTLLLRNQQKKNKQRNGQANINNDAISNEMIGELEQEIIKLQQFKKQSEKIWHDKIRTVETEIQLKKVEEEKKIIMLKEKQKEFKLNEIRIRELRKLIKHKIVTEHTKRHEDADMSRYRHKRNIRYFDPNS